VRQKLGTIVGLFATLTALVTVVSIINILLGLDLGFGTAGATTELPKDSGSVLALGVVALFFGAIAAACLRPNIPGWAIGAASVGAIAAIVLIIYATADEGYHKSDLEAAAERDDVDGVREALASDLLSGPDLPAALYWALASNNVEIISELAAGFARWDQSHEDTQRCEGFERAAYSENISAVKMLVDAGATPRGCTEFLDWLHERTEFGSADMKAIARLLDVEIKQ
tara:strand:- start:89201 stop:89884 length:684 start_codon:yes stop_codon:yes gene_type:complete